MYKLYFNGDGDEHKQLSGPILMAGAVCYVGYILCYFSFSNSQYIVYH